MYYISKIVLYNNQKTKMWKTKKDKTFVPNWQI